MVDDEFQIVYFERSGASSAGHHRLRYTDGTEQHQQRGKKGGNPVTGEWNGAVNRDGTLSSRR